MDAGPPGAGKPGRPKCKPAAILADRAYDSQPLPVRQNMFTNLTCGVSGGTYQDNLTSGCPNPVSSGNDDDGNF